MSATSKPPTGTRTPNGYPNHVDTPELPAGRPTTKIHPNYQRVDQPQRYTRTTSSILRGGIHTKIRNRMKVDTASKGTFIKHNLMLENAGLFKQFAGEKAAEESEQEQEAQIEEEIFHEMMQKMFMPFSNVARKISCSSSRFRSYSSTKKTAAPSNEDQGADEPRAFVDDGLPKDYKVRTLKTESRRLDTVVKKATNLSMSATEKAILSGCVRINEEVKTKRGTVVEQDDEIDVWESAYEDNQDLANVKQIYIHSWTLADDGYQIVVKCWKKFVTDNWKRNNSQ